MNMPSKKDLCCCEMKALRAEIDGRARNLMSARAFEGRGRGPFAGTPTPALIRTLRDRQRAIYGTDDRKDIYEVADAELRTLADSVAALVEAPNLRATSSGRLRLTTSSYKDDYELCDGETFANQPLGCFCSGFLVAPDVIATAGHCVRSTISARRTRFVFGFRMLDRDRARTEFAKRDVYEGVALLAREETDSHDWALVKLDRRVVGRMPIRVRESGKIADERGVFVIGHPNGLPAKYAGGAKVRDNRNRAIFTANLDTYGGNSGSPVFDQRTKIVEGILVSGEQDFVQRGDCYVSLICPDARCSGESVTRSTVWVDRIPD
jgi:Trypsin-like peptidase domain